MTATAAERAVLVRRWERASELPLMIAAVVFLAAYAVPILDPDLPSWLLDLCRSLSWITWGIVAVAEGGHGPRSSSEAGSESMSRRRQQRGRFVTGYDAR